MIRSQLYDQDVLAWSQHQTSALAELSRDPRAAAIDWPNVIAVIAAVGREEEARVHDALRAILRSAIAGYCNPDSHQRIAWSLDMLGHQAELMRGIEPSIRSRIDLDTLWGEAFDLAIPSVREEIVTVPPGIPAACPFTLDDLLDEGFTYETAVKRLYDRLNALNEDRSP